jgi:hypothetical protein
MDGYLTTTEGEIILVEVKTTLGWGQLQAACFQMLAGNHLLGHRATKGLIVFERLSPGWATIKPAGGWTQLSVHAAEIAPHLTIDALQITLPTPLTPLAPTIFTRHPSYSSISIVGVGPLAGLPLGGLGTDV